MLKQACPRPDRGVLHDDPREVLEDRCSNQFDIAFRIAKKYDFAPIKISPIEKGYRNESHPVMLEDGSTINIMIFKNEPGILQSIQNANAVSGYLAQSDFPARKLVDPRIISLTNKNHRKYAAVYNYLPGQTIPWEAYSQKHLKLLGKTLSDMHAALQSFDAGQLPEVTQIYRQIVRRMQRYFSQPGVRHAMTAKLNLQIDDTIFSTYDRLLEACESLPSQQALHMDFVRSNILFEYRQEGPKITGILDFEKTARGNPVFDIARTYAFLLVDCKYKPAEKVRKYFLYSGFQKRGKADLPTTKFKTQSGNVKFLDALTDLFLFYDLYKFLRHNPYEYLHQNEHFTRTCELLLGRTLLHCRK